LGLVLLILAQPPAFTANYVLLTHRTKPGFRYSPRGWTQLRVIVCIVVFAAFHRISDPRNYNA
jgi:hypothetical protein